jgi:hypothetical protein
MKKLITILLAIITTNLNAATFLYDDLTTNYVDGNLVGQNGWTQTATASNNPIQYFSGKVVVGSTGQDTWKSLTTQITKANVSTVYTRIDMSVVNAQATGDYFFSLSDPAGSSSNFYQRLFIRASGSGFNLGLQSTSGTGSLTVWGSSVYNLNELLSVVIAWDMVGGALNDTFSLYVNPLTNDRTLLTSEITSNWNSTTGAEPTLTISALNLRQGSATTAPTTYVEELWVGDSLSDVGITTIPEPSSWSLILIGCGSLIALRRLKRNG